MFKALSLMPSTENRKAKQSKAKQNKAKQSKQTTTNFIQLHPSRKISLKVGLFQSNNLSHAKTCYGMPVVYLFKGTMESTC